MTAALASLAVVVVAGTAWAGSPRSEWRDYQRALQKGDCDDINEEYREYQESLAKHGGWYGGRGYYNSSPGYTYSSPGYTTRWNGQYYSRQTYGYAQPQMQTYGQTTQQGQQFATPPAPPEDDGIASAPGQSQSRTALRPNLDQSQQVDDLQREIDQLRAENRRLRSQLDQQSTNPQSSSSPARPPTTPEQQDTVNQPSDRLDATEEAAPPTPQPQPEPEPEQ